MTARVVVTTIVRGAPLAVPAGWLRVLSLDGEQEAMAPLPDALHRALDTNQRGGLRGGRGLAGVPGRLAVAINDRILVLDRDWRVVRVISHPWMGGLHDVAADLDGLWATCADNDLLLRLDWDGELRESWHWRKDRTVRRELGHGGWLPGFDRAVDHRYPRGGGLRVDLGHVNAVAVDDEGSLLVGLGLVRPPVRLGWPAARARVHRLTDRAGVSRLAAAASARWRRTPAARLAGGWFTHDLTSVTPGAISFLSPDAPRPEWTWAVAEVTAAGRGRRPRGRVVARHPAAGKPAHNVAVSGDLLVVNDSASGRVLGLDRATGAIARSVSLPGELPFPRGLLDLGGGRFLIGTQDPAALHVVDLEAERLEERILLPEDRGESPYAIAAVPAGFGDAGGLPRTRAAWGIPGGNAAPETSHSPVAAATS